MTDDLEAMGVEVISKERSSLSEDSAYDRALCSLLDSPHRSPWYEKSLLDGIELPTIAQAHASVLRYRDHPNIDTAATLLNTLYRHSPERIIRYDLPLRLDFIGSFLREDQVFIVQSAVPESALPWFMGRCSRAMIVGIDSQSETCRFELAPSGAYIRLSPPVSFFYKEPVSIEEAVRRITSPMMFYPQPTEWSSVYEKDVLGMNGSAEPEYFFSRSRNIFVTPVIDRIRELLADDARALSLSPDPARAIRSILGEEF